MILTDAMAELGDALQGIVGLRVFPYWVDSIEPPAAIVEFPDSYTFDETYGRGADRALVPLVVAVARVDTRSAGEQLAAYAAGAGARSIKQAIEDHSYTALDSARVTGIEFGALTVAGTEYLAATFTIDIIGTGE